MVNKNNKEVLPKKYRLPAWLAVGALSAYAVIPLTGSDNSNVEEYANSRPKQESGIERVVENEENYESKNDQVEDSKKDGDSLMIEIASYIAPNEGRIPQVYCAQSPEETDRNKFKEPTIGVGHYMDRGDSREVFKEVLPDVSYEDVYSGKEKLTEEQIDRLFAEDIGKYIERTKRFFPNFNDYPEYLQSALVDGVYRGCLSGSPNTRELISEGKFEEAANEYLNHKEYNTARERGMSGVATRMEKNRDAMLKYAREMERE